MKVIYSIPFLLSILFLMYHYYKKNKNTPKVPKVNYKNIEACRNGECVQIQGRVKAIDESTILREPFFDTPCIYYEIVVERYDLDHWTHILQEDKIVPFIIAEEGHDTLVVKGNLNDTTAIAESTSCEVHTIASFIIDGKNRILDQLLTLQGIAIRPSLSWFEKYYTYRVKLAIITIEDKVSAEGIVYEMPSEDGAIAKQFFLNNTSTITIQKLEEDQKEWNIEQKHIMLGHEGDHEIILVRSDEIE